MSREYKKRTPEHIQQEDEIILSCLVGGMSMKRIAEKLDIKYYVVANAKNRLVRNGKLTAAQMQQKKIEQSIGRNADRHLCRTCRYRGLGAGLINSNKPRCEYILRDGDEDVGKKSRPCKAEDCYVYERGPRKK